MENEDAVKENIECPICGNTNTEVLRNEENAYGEFVKICLCGDCDVEFEIK